jgi:hypothetical protein
MTLDSDRVIALSQEIDATSTLLRHGQEILAQYRFAARDAEAVFVCLAGGTEKLLKLTYGLIAIDEGGEWPRQATMKEVGHRITELNLTVVTALTERAARSTAPGLIKRLLDWTTNDPGISLVLETMERYAVSGRFYNLDLLGGVEQPAASPQELWEELHWLVIEANPELLEQFAGTEAAEAQASVNTVIRASLGAWCELLLRSWMTGVCGPEAQRWSPQLEMGHAVPGVVRDP